MTRSSISIEHWQSKLAARTPPVSAQVYRREGDRYVIDLSLRDEDDLFNVFDPAPFGNRDLAAGAEDYLAGAAHEIGARHGLKLIVHVPNPDELRESRLRRAIQNYFAYRARDATQELHRTLIQGVSNLCIALLFLFICLWIRHSLTSSWTQTVAVIVNEGLLIMGWVAMWRPIETFLYDWWPITRGRHTFSRLATMPIEFCSPASVDAHEDATRPEG